MHTDFIFLQFFPFYQPIMQTFYKGCDLPLTEKYLLNLMQVQCCSKFCQANSVKGNNNYSNQMEVVLGVHGGGGGNYLSRMKEGRLTIWHTSTKAEILLEGVLWPATVEQLGTPGLWIFEGRHKVGVLRVFLSEKLNRSR